jgi:hypothetical protein
LQAFRLPLLLSNGMMRGRCSLMRGVHHLPCFLMQYNHEHRLEQIKKLICLHGFEAHCMTESHASGALCMCVELVSGWVMNEYGDIYPPEDVYGCPAIAPSLQLEHGVIDHAAALARALWEIATTYGILVSKEEREQKKSAAIEALARYWEDNPDQSPWKSDSAASLCD